MLKNLFALPIVAATVLIAGAACASDAPATNPTSTPGSGDPQNIQVAFSDKSRSSYEGVSVGDISELVDGNTAFALDLYRVLSEQDGNLFFSPHSISLALAMTHAGTAGQTEAEMRQALHFTLEQARLHAALNALDQELAKRGQDAPEDEKFRLEIANSIWGQQGFPFEEEFLDTLAESYGAGMRMVDFVPAETREAARRAINQWVEDNTENRIRDLIPEGVLDEMTRLVLVNAIYFKASWLHTFDEDQTRNDDFTRLDGSTVTVPMMNLPTSHSRFKYDEGAGYQAIELPYVGESASMVILLPNAGEFAGFEANLDTARLNEILSGMNPETGHVAIPKFEFESEFSLSDALKALGMEQAFDPSSADFSRMSSEVDDLYITEVLHKAFVSVDEEGTEAAAATAVIIGATSMPLETFNFVADRPFIFLIRDNETGAILFLGRVLDPGT